MKLPEKILRHRKQLGLSQEELAARLGVTRQAVSKWELGTSVPELETLLALSKVFGVTTDYLLTDEENAPPQSAAPEGKGNAYPDWVNHLPWSLRRLFLRYGWLSGVYVAVMGLLWILMGAFAKYQNRQMFGGLDMYGGIDMELMMPGYRDPITTFASFIQLIGVIFVAAGILLALWLRHKGKQDK